MALVIPDITLLDTCNKLLRIIRDDYHSNITANTESRSLLYTLFHALTLDKYDVYDNIKKIIITTPENPKHIDYVTLSFDQNSNKTPHLYLTLPSESTINNSLGIGEGDQNELVYDNFPQQSEYRKQFNRRYLTTYYLVIVSENRNENLILYHLFKNLLVSCTNHLHLSGLQNLKIGGQDLKINTGIPDKIFMKAITLSFEYEQQVPELVVKNIYHKLQIYWKPEGAITAEGPIEIDSDDSDADSF